MMDLRERVLMRRGHAGGRGREQIPRRASWPAAQTTARETGKSPRASSGTGGIRSRVPADTLAALIREQPDRTLADYRSPGYVRQSGDDLAGRETAGPREYGVR